MQIDVVIPNYNGKAFLYECLTSLRNQTCKDFNVLVVDNGSTDGSVEYLQAEFQEVKVIALPENKGFSAAVNAGINSGKAPLVFLLNNDTKVAPHCIEYLLEAALQNQGFDFFASKMINYHDHSLLDGAGEGFLRGGVGYRLGTMENDSRFYSTSREVFGACAGAALYRKSLFEEIGTFDEDYFAYLEDVDFNLRANCRGKKCWYVSEAEVYHIGSATTGSKINEFTVRLSTKNNFNTIVKNYPSSLLLRFSLTILIYQFFWFCFIVKKKQIPAYFLGLLEFAKEVKDLAGKRRKNFDAMILTNKELAEIIRRAEKEAIESIMNRRKEKGQGNLFFQIYLSLFM